MSWFDAVTGSNEYQRQSWRDSYNGGRAAGDLTGATNARIDAERAAFQGTTWSGSSTQPSALELARSMSGTGPGMGHVGGGGSTVSSGPGNPGVSPASPVSQGSLPMAGTGPGNQMVWVKANKTIGVPASHVQISELQMLEPVLEPTNTAIMIGGMPFMPQPGTSNAQEIEDMMGDGDSPMEMAWWFKQGANIGHVGYNIGRWARDPGTKQWAEDFDRAVVDAFSTPW